MAGRLRRFLHLERARPSGPGRATPDARRRFDALEVQPELPEGASPLATSAAERFRMSADGALALDVAPEGEQPFVRCASCETDHARHTERCSRCGAALDTPEQRTFNERLWEARRREAEEEGRAIEERRQARQRESEEAARARRALAETMADEILLRESLEEPWLLRAGRWFRNLISRE